MAFFGVHEKMGPSFSSPNQAQPDFSSRGQDFGISTALNATISRSIATNNHSEFFHARETSQTAHLTLIPDG